jgi:hypothetical protein
MPRVLITIVVALFASVVVDTAAAEPVATLRGVSPVAADAGYAVWSDYDSSSGQYRLAARTPAGVVGLLPVAPGPVAFRIDLGRGPDGNEVAVFARCTHEPTDAVDGPPGDQASGCTLESFDFATGAARALAVTAPAGNVIYAPTVSGARIAFAYVVPGENRPRIALARLDGTGPAHQIARGPVRVCTRRAFSRGPSFPKFCAPAKDVSLPGLDLDGDRLAFAWSYYGYTIGGPRYRTELRTENVAAGGSSRLVVQATGDLNGSPVYSAPALHGGKLRAILTCRRGPACRVQPDVAQRVELGRGDHAEAQLPFVPLSVALDGDAALLLARPPHERFARCGRGCELDRTPLRYVIVPRLPRARGCGVVRSGRVLLSVRSAGRECGSAQTLVHRAFPGVLRRGYGRLGTDACIRLGQSGLVPQVGETLIACRRHGASVRGAYAGGLPPNTALGPPG